MKTRSKILSTCLILLGGLAFEAQAQSSSEIDEIIGTGGGGGSIKKGGSQTAPGKRSPTDAPAAGKARLMVKIVPSTPGDVEFLGDSASRSRESLCKTVQKRVGTLARVLERNLESRPDLRSGEIVIRLTVAPGGNVLGSKAIRSTTGDPELDSELSEKCRQLEFGAVPTGDVVFTVRVAYEVSGR